MIDPLLFIKAFNLHIFDHGLTVVTLSVILTIIYQKCHFYGPFKKCLNIWISIVRKRQVSKVMFTTHIFDKFTTEVCISNSKRMAINFTNKDDDFKSEHKMMLLVLSLISLLLFIKLFKRKLKIHAAKLFIHVRKCLLCNSV